MRSISTVPDISDCQFAVHFHILVSIFLKYNYARGDFCGGGRAAPSAATTDSAEKPACSLSGEGRAGTGTGTGTGLPSTMGDVFEGVTGAVAVAVEMFIFPASGASDAFAAAAAASFCARSLARTAAAPAPIIRYR
jgi:hypothetical protein